MARVRRAAAAGVAELAQARQVAPACVVAGSVLAMAGVAAPDVPELLQPGRVAAAGVSPGFTAGVRPAALGGPELTRVVPVGLVRVVQARVLGVVECGVGALGPVVVRFGVGLMPAGVARVALCRLVAALGVVIAVQ